MTELSNCIINPILNVDRGDGGGGAKLLLLLIFSKLKLKRKSYEFETLVIFHKDYLNTSMESFQFPDPPGSNLLTINCDLIPEMLDFKNF